MTNKALVPIEETLSQAAVFFGRLGLEEQFVREQTYAKQAMIANEQLKACDPTSILKALCNLAMTGLTLDPVRKLAYLIPRKEKGVLQCILQPSYRGMIHTVTKGGQVVTIEAKVVYFGDEFECVEGLDPVLIHRSLDLVELPTTQELKLLTLRRTETYKQIRCIYTVAMFKGGERSFTVTPKWRLDKAKACARGTDNASSPWRNWPEEQVRKTGIAYHCKTLDVGSEAAAAVELFHDNDGMAKIAEKVTSNLLASLPGLKLLETSTHDPLNTCGTCGSVLDSKALCHNTQCSEGVPA